MIWHWDQYVAKNNLWRHFNRFAQVVSDLDPVAERLKPFYFETEDLRVYGLKGNKTCLVWCRDRKNTWEAELKDGITPRELTGIALPLDLTGIAKLHSARSFDPWKNEWKDVKISARQILLPGFRRSLVVKVNLK